MDDIPIEELLNEEEGPTLDFKEEQYSFDGAEDEDKSELLKDILAFANAWRRASAFILIGVEQVRGGRSIPRGVHGHLEDSHLQQFVNSKTNRPVDFRHEVVSLDRVQIDVIAVPVQQRPIFSRKDFGKVKKDVVYLRRGSSTAIARPDEIARMGAVERASPQLIVIARVTGQRKGTFVVSIKNNGAGGDARAPYLELSPPGPFQVAQFGLDGSGNHGLALLPHSPEIGRHGRFCGTTRDIIHPGTSREITKIALTSAVSREERDVN